MPDGTHEDPQFGQETTEAENAPEVETSAGGEPAADEEFQPLSVKGGEGNPNPAAVETAENEHDPPQGLPNNRVTVNQYNKRNDDDIIEGSFVRIVDGEHKGRWGAYTKTVAYDSTTGYPSKILVQTRDDEFENLVVNIENVEVKPSPR